MRYIPENVEPKWQEAWAKDRTFAVPNEPADGAKPKPKYYVLDMFPYPSGHGLHVGHLKGYVASDIIARYKRMCGFDVLHPMGWDSFGLPAERQAVTDEIHPSKITERNIAKFRAQLEGVGLSYDWDREIATSDEDYYRWTQWIFLQLFERGLAYTAEVPVNWCPALSTVLANEEVKDGLYVETGDPVERRSMRQWMLKITAYAERLLEDLELVDWPEGVKEMQRNWIGKSIGARIKFVVADTDHAFEVFTTRPDTLFGCTYCTLAPEHPLVREITTTEQKSAVEAYVEEAANRSERDRVSQAEAKTGCFTGAYAVCPVSGERVPIWISDYVLVSYGTGAVFACPAHDERDHGFAKRFDLPIREVVKGGDVDEAPYTDDGPHVNSEFLDDLDIEAAKTRVIGWLEENGHGGGETQYRLRDWLFSRQRYWGEPIPVVLTADGETRAVAESDLPISLPHLDKFQATEDGQPPLARDPEWMATTVPGTDEPATRETNTMPQWAGSCWYYLRFIDPKNEARFCGPEAEKRWMPVDLYIGGAEHATLHLLYARFWHKVLYDIGVVSTKEPFQKLVNQGMITAQSYQSAAGKYYYPHDVEKKGEEYYAKDGTGPLETQIQKMSKSRYNVTTPDEVIEEYGADSLRLYEAFLGPVTESAAWDTANISGMKRFLDRAWRLLLADGTGVAAVTDDDPASDPAMDAVLHKTIKSVTEDLEAFSNNTAISHLMVFVNEATKRGALPRPTIEAFVKMLSPFAPHLAEELWSVLGHETSVALADWPVYDPAKTIDDQIEIAVQVNGKLRGTITAARDSAKDDLEAAARANDNVKTHIEGKNVVKVIVVPNKLVNFAVKG